MPHAKLGASNSHRWLYCPGSVEACKNLPDTKSLYADEGTAAHALAELSLRNIKSPFEWEGKQLPDVAWSPDAEMCGHVQDYVDFVRSKIRNASDELYIEERVSYSEWVPEGFGTCDAIVISNMDTMHIIDLKYGKGVAVFAEENTQAILYALGAYQEYGMLYDFKKIIITIMQPRLDNISEWEISVEELLKWGEWISERAAEARKPNAPRVPGEKQCRFCRAQADCPALYKMTAEILACEFEDMTEAENPLTGLSDEQKRRVLENKSLILSWIDAIETNVKERIESGEEFPGYKLVEGRSLRQWQDEEEAAQKLETLIGEKAWEKKLLSVAKAEKALGKKNLGEIASLIVKPAGKPTLVPDTDKRESISVTAEDFD